MLFNTLDFAIFLPIVFLIYWFILGGKLKLQNFLIVISSYVFYGWWDPKFLLLIVFSTLVDYSIGLLLNKEENPFKRKLLLWISISINLGFLGYFKYCDFFIENFVHAFSFFGFNLDITGIDIILPVGISFYTFQTLSYTIDVYKKKLNATTDLIAFSAFVSFFPQLVAGPIERATHLLPQFYSLRYFHYSLAANGLRQILWGLFKKIVIADNCAVVVNQIFNHSNELNGSSLVIGAIFFSFQIYGDFSGYSDIAIGTSKLFGFDLMQNFNFPYFSRDIAEFWRKWHISLSTWFRDYMYIPLGGSKVSKLKQIRNTIIIFIISGFWHGANWTFIIWGALNALYILPLILTNQNRKNTDEVQINSIKSFIKTMSSIVFTFSLTVFAWVFFRAENLSHALNYISGIFSTSLFHLPNFSGRLHAFTTLGMIIIFMTFEWIGKKDAFAIEKIGAKYPFAYRYLMYYLILFAIIWFNGKEQQFIYFQF